MRDFKELKKAAYTGREITSSSPFEYAIWVTMRHIYGMYESGMIDKDKAKSMARKCEQDHGILVLHERICDKWQKRERDTELLRAEFCKNPTAEARDKLLRAIMPEIYELKK